MSAYPSENCWIVKIVTDSYAGNFERDMTAYCTGMVGDCMVGSELADMYHEEVEDDPFFEKGLWVADDHGCARPCYMDMRDTNAVLIFLNDEPTQRELDVISERALEFAKKTELGRCRDTINVRHFELKRLTVKYDEVSVPWNGADG